MACELIGAKLVAPYFGASLYVWASVLAVTLGGLAAGYFLGGYFSKRYNNRNLLFYVLLLAGIFLFGMPAIGKFALEHTIDMSVQAGSLVSLMMFLFPPLVCFGMSSPIIINLLTDTADNSGRNAGLIYSVSTVGGILITLLCGFYILPQYGIAHPAMFFGGIMISVSLIYFFLKKKYFALLAMLLLFFLSPPKTSLHSDRYHVLYESEGMLGQIKVIDHKYYSEQKGWKMARGLFVNNIAQTVMDLENTDYSLWDYAFYVSHAASIFPKGSNVLLCGLGGGTLYKQFRNLGFNVDVVELDKRIGDLAVKYFSVNPDINVAIDDARHYMRTCKKKYDIIFFDTFRAETPPAYVITLESLKAMRKNLNPGGAIMVNFYGFYSGSLGSGAGWMYKTFIAADYTTKILMTNLKNEKLNNLVFIASDKNLDFSKTNYTEPGMPELNNLNNNFLDVSRIELADAGILTDDKPMLEYLAIKPSIEWRNAYNDFFTKNFLKEEVGIFK